MNIFVVNGGSSSLKCSLYRFEKSVKPTSSLWSAQIDWKNEMENIQIHLKSKTRDKKITIEEKKSLSELLVFVLDHLWKGEMAVLSSLDEIDRIGHRIVHGGSEFQESILIDESVKAKLKEISRLAPLHNDAELENIEALEKLLKTKPQFAVFDTAFHHTLPKKVAIYPGPYRWYEEKIQRYGFHGISFQYCLSKALEWTAKESKIVICHLGSGASLAAIKDGISIDTTMGFTPLEGLMMDTRSGTVDPGILFHLLEKTSPKKLERELYFESGLLGLSGLSSDMRDIIQNKDHCDRCSLAIDVYLHRLNAMIGSMIASLQGLDALIFTAGIGENSPWIRTKVCENFSFLGIDLDEKSNHNVSVDSAISTHRSTVKVLVIHTQEAFEIARQVFIRNL